MDSDSNNEEMSRGAVSLAQKYGLPPFNEDQDFDNWMHEVDLWQDVTEQKKEKHASIVYLSLPAKARQACSSITKEELNRKMKRLPLVQQFIKCK